MKIVIDLWVVYITNLPLLLLGPFATPQELQDLCWMYLI